MKNGKAGRKKPETLQEHPMENLLGFGIIRMKGMSYLLTRSI